MKKSIRIVTFLCVAMGFGASGCGRGPVLVSTATLTFTSTPASTPAPSSTSTATVTPTPSPTFTAQEEPDGRTLVTDYQDKFQLLLSSPWFVTDFTSTAFLGDLAKYGVDPLFVEAYISGMKTAPQVIGFTKDRKYDAQRFPASIVVQVFDDEASVSTPLDALVASNEQHLQQNNWQILKVRRAVSPNPSGVEFGTFDALSSSPGSNVKLRDSFVLFKSNGKLVLITLGTASNLADELSPAMDTVIGNLRLLGP